MTTVPLTNFDSASPTNAAAAHDLARHALAALIAHAVEGMPLSAAFRPVVLVVPDVAAAEPWLVALEREAAAVGVARWRGTDLASAIAAACRADTLAPLAAMFAAPRMVIVQGVELLETAEPQRVFSRLLDAAAAHDTAVCIAVPSPPTGAGFAPELESRLTAGLVVPLGLAAAGHRAAEPMTRPTCRRVIRVTAAHFGIPVATLVGSGRQRSVVHARSLAMYLSRRLTGKSLDAIGQVFGGRDHSTVLRSIRSVHERSRQDAAFAGDVERLVDSFAGRRKPA